MLQNLAAKLPLLFAFGIAFATMLAGMATAAYLLYRLLSTLRSLTLPPEQRRQAKQAAKHPFAGTSLRAKTAYLICCLEQALDAYGLDAEQEEPGSWYPVLRLLWELPELPEASFEEWLAQTTDILPSTLLAPEPPTQPLPPEKQEPPAAARALYTTAGYRMALLAPLIEFPVRLVRENREAPAARPEQALALLDEAMELLESYDVPLPGVRNRDFLLRQRSPGVGEMFVGRQCSGIVGW